MITLSVSVVWPWFFYECKARILGIISNTQNMVMACIEKLLDAIEIRLRQSNMRSSDSIWTGSQGGVELDFKFRISKSNPLTFLLFPTFVNPKCWTLFAVRLVLGCIFIFNKPSRRTYNWIRVFYIYPMNSLFAWEFRYRRPQGDLS